MSGQLASKAEALAREIDARLAALPERKTAAVRGLRREYTELLKPAEPALVLALAERLLDYPSFDHHFVGYELVHFHRQALRQLDRPMLERFGRHLDGWYEVDTFSLFLAGPAWRAGQIGDETIGAWASAVDRWWRRSALVCTVALNSKARGGKGDVARTLRVCQSLVGDRDDMVVKAMSWALRELIPYDQSAVRRFLAENESALAGRVKREVAAKLETGLKNPRRRPG